MRGVPLIVRSAYALLRSPVMPQTWVQAARRAGYTTVVLADWAALYGALPFLEAAEEAGLHGVLGVELPAAPGARLLVLCEDLCGYRNVAELLSRLHLAPPADPLTLIADQSDGLICLTDDAALLAILRERMALRDLAALLPQQGSLRRERELREAAERLDIPAVAIAAATLVASDQAATLHLMNVIRRGGLLAGEDGEETAWHRSPARHDAAAVAWPLAPAREVAACGAQDPATFHAGRRLLERCRLRLCDLRPRTFIFPRVGGNDGCGRLRTRCRRGLAQRGLEASAACRRRLERELAVIEQLGFVDYFLATARIVDWARSRDIPAVGRGSGVASLVAYLLGITNVNPVSCGLYFERFLHPLRRDYPDLDIDIAWNRRDEVLDYALRAFGPERAAMIGTHQFFRARGAFRATARALGLADEALRRAARRLPRSFLGRGADRETERARLRRLGRDPDPAVRRAAAGALALLGLPHGIGVHASGVVLADGPLKRIVPLERSANGVRITQFDMRATERMGLIKIDFLGNRALGTLDETVRAIRAAGGEIDLTRVPEKDSRTGELLARGCSLGCVQIESPAVRMLLRQLRAGSRADVVAALSLVRPGPSSSGMKAAYIQHAQGATRAPAIHPAVAGILQETHGIPLYQEDVMCLAAATAGTSHAEADMLRRAIAATAPRAGSDGAARADLQRLERGFLAAARGRGHAAAAAAAVWQQLLRFAGYAFCKAHAAGYGVLAYQCAYLKAHYPGPFFAALMNNHRGMYPLRVYGAEARRRGLRLLAPCVEQSGREWRWEAGEGAGRLRCGLGRVRGLGGATVERLLCARNAGPFRDLGDFLQRSGAHADELEALVLCGAFDAAWGLPRGELLWRMHRLGRRRRAGATRTHANQAALAIARREPLSPAGGRGPWREISGRHRARLERHFLGLSLSLHAVELWQPGPAAGVVAVAELPAAPLGPVQLAGIISALRAHRPARGGAMLFFTLEDATGLIECICQGERMLRQIPGLCVDHLVRVTGRLADRYGARIVRVSEVRVAGEH